MRDVKTLLPFDPAKPDSVVIAWADGVITEWDLKSLNPEILRQAVRTGIATKTSSAHAGIFKKTGSVPECRDLSVAVWNGLAGPNGTWDSLRTSGLAVLFLTESPAIFSALRKAKIPGETPAAMVSAFDENRYEAFMASTEFKAWNTERLAKRAKAIKAPISLAAMLLEPPEKKVRVSRVVTAE